MSALDEFTKAFTAGWEGEPLESSESVAVKAAHKAGRRDRADHDYWEQKEDKA